VLWLGLDGLDREYLDALAAEGTMPNWSVLSREGYRADLQSYVPILSPLIWTTEETGVGPETHRVLDFQEVDASGGIVPISEASRKVAALWNIASDAGRKVGVVGFWATHPAERVRGFFLSDRIVPFRSESSTSGTAFPESLEPFVARAVSRDGEVPAADLVPYLDLPEASIAASLAAGKDIRDPVSALGKILGATRLTQRLSRDLYDRVRPDLLAAYFEGTDEIGHIFAPNAPPRLACADPAEYAAFHRAPSTYFRMIDRLLGQWMRRAREDGAVLLVTSDHGFLWGAGRPCSRSSLDFATAASWHRPLGVFLAWGPGIAAATAPPPVSAFDVAPTILALLGLPGDSRMKGSVVGVRPGLALRRDRELLSRTAVSTVSAKALSAAEGDAYAKKLIALGYLTPGDARGKSIPAPSGAGLTKGGWNNLGVYLYYSRHDIDGARAAWTRALEIDSRYHSPLLNLGVLERDRGNLSVATSWLLKAVDAGHPEPEKTVEGWAREFERARAGAGRSLLGTFHAKYPENPSYARDLALMLARAKQCDAAERIMAPLESSNDWQSLNVAAIVETCLDRPDRVGVLLRRSIEINPDQPSVREAIDSLPR